MTEPDDEAVTERDTVKRVRISTARPVGDPPDFARTANQLHDLRRPARARSARVLTLVVLTALALFVIAIARLQ